MTNPLVFYAKEDQWQAPTLGDSDRNATPMRPYYTVMKLPGQKQGEFLQMLPLTPQLKNNLRAWMVARSDGANYGQLFCYEFPKQSIVYGPQQIDARINQDQVISPQITLWNQQGSQVIWGTLLVIPIEESLLYVRPLYLQSNKGIPELKRVVVAYRTQIVMEETLQSLPHQDFRRPDRLGPAGRQARQQRDVRGRQGSGGLCRGRRGGGSLTPRTGQRGLRPLRPDAEGRPGRRLGALRRRAEEARRDDRQDDAHQEVTPWRLRQ